MLNYKTTGPIVNLTPHPITILNKDNEVIETIPISKMIARCSTERTLIGHIKVGEEQIPSYKTIFGEVYIWNIMYIGTLEESMRNTVANSNGWESDMLPYRPDIILIVSNLVAQALPHRTDLVFPDDIVRNIEGNIIGCKALSKS